MEKKKSLKDMTFFDCFLYLTVSENMVVFCDLKSYKKLTIHPRLQLLRENECLNGVFAFLDNIEESLVSFWY